jgi:hypothetical protein
MLFQHPIVVARPFSSLLQFGDKVASVVIDLPPAAATTEEPHPVRRYGAVRGSGLKHAEPPSWRHASSSDIDPYHCRYIMTVFSGDTHCINNRTDGNRSVTFNIDVNGDAFGSTHSGAVTCEGPVRIVSEERRDGSGHYSGSVNGNIYTWHTQCSNFSGVHYTVELAY